MFNIHTHIYQQPAETQYQPAFEATGYIYNLLALNAISTAIGKDFAAFSLADRLASYEEPILNRPV